jgi:valyl-tRNA synthetase
MHLMPTELPKQYDPKEAQEKWLKFWNERGYFQSNPPEAHRLQSVGLPYTIVIPPPNVTGALHMGHALNNTLQDVLIRWRRMQGFNALWMPGTDHAGIATQAVVEKRIAQEEKKTRHDLGREVLVKRIWQWKDVYEKRILTQLQQLGCSCDWRRTRFTLDEQCSRAVRQTFFEFFKRGLIFRGKRLVNWDTQLQTSVADDETFHETVKGHFWTFKYPLKGTNEFIRFSTTRPETMLGDTAVAVHPTDQRYKHLIGKLVTIPLVNRDIPIIADGLLVDPALGTGAVKVTPAHDPNDYQCGLRHKLPMINILNPDGTINQEGKQYAGLERYEARKRVTADMEAFGLLESVEDREIDLAHSDRSKTPIEPYLSDQWFVRMGDRTSPLTPTPSPLTPLPQGGEGDQKGLAQLAMDAVTSGRVKIHPERYAKTYLDWLGEKRDWCISRQLWWGHRIPVWTFTFTGHKNILDKAAELEQQAVTCKSEKELDRIRQEKHQLLTESTINQKGDVLPGSPDQITWQFRLNEDGTATVFASIAPNNPRVEDILIENGYSRDPDVLDTWFSSALWPHSTLGWPEQTAELKYYYPTSVLVTSRDIITLWVARMVLTGLFNVGDVPFKDVYITPKLLDGFGETMSKSKGNGVDPLDLIERYGTDALRFQMTALAGETQDCRLPVSNVCPHCDTLIPVKQEHMYMRTRKVTCPSCKKPFRPGGPWPGEDSELKTAKQASESFEQGRNFANKLWNAARFVLMNLEGYTPGTIQPTELPAEDQWILSRLADTTVSVTQALESFRFSEAIRTLYDFTWSEFCDWYLEMAKSRLKEDRETGGQGDKETGRILAQRVLGGVLDSILKLLHPVMPFVTESIWQALNEAAFERGLPHPEPAAESVMIAAWPNIPNNWRNAKVESRLGRMQELVRQIRNLRNQFNVNERAFIDVSVRCSRLVAGDLQQLAMFIQPLAKVGQFHCGPDITRPPQSATAIHSDYEAYVHLQGLIDVPAEIQRMKKQRAEKEKQLLGVRAKLANASFVDRAPADVVQQQKQLETDLLNQLKAIDDNLQHLGE